MASNGVRIDTKSLYSLLNLLEYDMDRQSGPSDDQLFRRDSLTNFQCSNGSLTEFRINFEAIQSTNRSQASNTMNLIQL